jgi:hypothetical protein
MTNPNIVLTAADRNMVRREVAKGRRLQAVKNVWDKYPELGLKGAVEEVLAIAPDTRKHLRVSWSGKHEQ